MKQSVPPTLTDMTLADEARAEREQTPDNDNEYLSSCEEQDNNQQLDKKHALRGFVEQSHAKRLRNDTRRSVAPSSIVTPGASRLTGREATGKETDTSSSLFGFMSFVDAEMFSNFDKDLQQMFFNAGVEMHKLDVEREKLGLENQKLDIERQKLKIEEFKIEKGLLLKEILTKADEAKAEPVKARTANRELVGDAATSTRKRIQRISLQQLVHADMLSPEVARTFARLMPIKHLPVEWSPTLKNIPKNIRDNGMTKDVMFKASSMQEVADAIINSLTMDERQMASDDKDAAAEKQVVINVITQSKNSPTTIHQVLHPLPSSKFDEPKRQKKEYKRDLGLMDTLRTSVKEGESCPSEWAEDYYHAWLGSAIAGKVPFKLDARRKVYSPEQQQSIRELEAVFRKDKWPSLRGCVPNWCKTR